MVKIICLILESQDLIVKLVLFTLLLRMALNTTVDTTLSTDLCLLPTFILMILKCLSDVLSKRIVFHSSLGKLDLGNLPYKLLYSTGFTGIPIDFCEL